MSTFYHTPIDLGDDLNAAVLNRRFGDLDAAISGLVIPTQGSVYTIQSWTSIAAGYSEVEIANIPQTFTHLMLEMATKVITSPATGAIGVRPNRNTAKDILTVSSVYGGNINSLPLTSFSNEAEFYMGDTFGSISFPNELNHIVCYLFNYSLGVTHHTLGWCSIGRSIHVQRQFQSIWVGSVDTIRHLTLRPVLVASTIRNGEWVTPSRYALYGIK